MSDTELRQLDGFNGTENYHKDYLGVLVTDGVRYIIDNGYGWLVSDAIVIIKELKGEDFLVVKLKVNDTEGVMTVEDGNGRIFHTQNYQYTDAKRDLTLYFQNNVLMLSGEY